jgi:hypothetical protein
MRARILCMNERLFLFKQTKECIGPGHTCMQWKLMRIPESNLVAGDFVNSSYHCQNLFLKHQFIGEDKKKGD